MNMATEYILQIQKDYYKRYEKFRDEILKSQRMTFFNKAELLEKMDQDMQEKIAELKEVDFACWYGRLDVLLSLPPILMEEKIYDKQNQSIWKIPDVAEPDWQF